MKEFFLEYQLNTVHKIKIFINNRSKYKPIGKIIILTQALSNNFMRISKKIDRKIFIFYTLGNDFIMFKHDRQKNWNYYSIANEENLRSQLNHYFSHEDLFNQLIDIKKKYAEEKNKFHRNQKNKLINLKVHVQEEYLIAKKKEGSFYSQVNKEIEKNLQTMSSLGLTSCFTPLQLTQAPVNSFALHFCFSLIDHWFSKDNTPLYPLENPVHKETVFQVPEMSSSSWKGVFLQAARELQLPSQQIKRLFGAANMANDDGVAGSLYFASSFFGRIELYTMNPHNRKTKAGTFPILYEVVPPGTKSTFSLLYVPPVVIPPLSNADINADYIEIGRLIERVFTQTGFGAKTSIGFGRARMVTTADSSPAAGQHNQLLRASPEPCPESFSSFEELQGLLNKTAQGEK